MTKVQEVGGPGRTRAPRASSRVRIVSRRKLIRLFQIPGLIVMPIVFASLRRRACSWLYPAIFLAGLLTVGQFSFWGNYLPRVYPLHLRGTGESFAANIGGRLIGTSFAWLTATLAVTSDRGVRADQDCARGRGRRRSACTSSGSSPASGCRSPTSNPSSNACRGQTPV